MRSVGAAPTGRGVLEPARLLECLQGLAQAFVLDSQRIAELGASERHAWGQQVEHLIVETAALLVVPHLGDHFQVGPRGIGGDQLQGHRGRCRCGAVFAGEHQVVVGAAEVEVRIAEGMNVAGTAQSLTGSNRLIANIFYRGDEYEPTIPGRKFWRSTCPTYTDRT